MIAIIGLVLIGISIWGYRRRKVWAAGTKKWFGWGGVVYYSVNGLFLIFNPAESGMAAMTETQLLFAASITGILLYLHYKILQSTWEDEKKAEEEVV